MQITQFSDEHLPQLQRLVNGHLSAVAPGWALTTGYLRDRLEANPDQYILDPWVSQRRTLGALEKGRVVAAAHLLHYRSDPDVSASYRGAADIAWLVAWPDSQPAAQALISACLETLSGWGAARIYAFDTGLPASVLAGLPDSWTHVQSTLQAAGFACQKPRFEAIYGGWLPRTHIGSPVEIRGLAFGRRVGRMDVTFTAQLNGREIGHCEISADLSEGGERPAFQRWGALFDLEIEADFRNAGIGSELVWRAVEWLRTAGCDRIVVPVGWDEEQAGVARFYERFGWRVMSRQTKGWEHLHR